MKSRSVSLKSQTGRLDKPLLIAVVALVFFGVAMVFDASAAESARTFGDKYFFLKRQALWAVCGLAALFIFSQVNYTFWRRLALPFLLFSALVLGLVLIPGVGVTVLGATRRISLNVIGANFGLQPSELAKLALTIYLAAVLSRKVTLFRFLLPTLLVCGLIFVEPDLGTSLIVAGSALAMYWVAGAPVLQLAVLALLGVSGAVFAAFLSPYRRARITTFLNPSIDPADTSYHIRQALIALGSGGLFGLGLGQSRQKHFFLPEPATDSIFAIIAEEFGFVGASVILAVFIFLFWRGMRIAWCTKEPFGRLLAVGITSHLAIQTLINLAAMVALVPLTGIPLPFVSYGGSSLVVLLAAVGILLNISKGASSTARRRR